jgi:16S rRNA (guanine1207-N2)-methyltransferase
VSYQFIGSDKGERMQSIGSTNPGTLLLVEESNISPTDRVLVLSADDPALTLSVARTAAAVEVYDISFSAIRRLRQQVASRLGAQSAAQPVTVNEDVFPPPGAQFDVALMVVPKGRDFARAQLWSALRALRPGGRLYIAGATNGGAKSVIADAQALYGHGVTLSTRRRNRIGVSIRPDTLPTDYPSDWGPDPTGMQQQTLETPCGPVTVVTMPGIFSWQRLDDGTAFLMENLNGAGIGEDVLDVGCGNGVLGVALARQVRRVTMVDDNLLAVRCARGSVEANGLVNAAAEPGDVYADVGHSKFDLIVSNPPFHKEFDVNTNVAHRIMRDARTRLRPGGRLIIVANAFLKYEDVMAQHLTKSRVIARNNRFIVIEGKMG